MLAAISCEKMCLCVCVSDVSAFDIGKTLVYLCSVNLTSFPALYNSSQPKPKDHLDTDRRLNYPYSI